MKDLNSNEFRESYESRVNTARENVFIKIENSHAVDSALNQVQVIYSALDLQKSKRAAEDSYRMNLFRSDFVSDGGLKDKFSKYYDSTTFNKSKTFRKSLSYTKLNSFTQSDNPQRNSGTFNNTCSEFGKFKPNSTKNSVVPFNKKNKSSDKEKEVKLTEPIVKRLHIKYNSNKTVCSLKLNNDKENLSKRYSSCNNEDEKNNLPTVIKSKSISKSLNADNKSSLIINNYFINSLNNANLANSIKEEKRLLTIEEKIEMMTKLVKTKEDIIIKQVRSELIQREKEKNSKIQKKLNYLNDRNMLENINDEIKVENHTTPNECLQDRLLSLRSANLEDKMNYRVKSASLLNFKIDKKQIFKPRVDSIEYLKKIFNEKKLMKGKDFSKTVRKYENNYLSNSFLKSASREKYKSITLDSKGFRESNYNSTYKSARNIKNEISDFIRRKNREHKENAIKLKDKENENLIKKYIELMKINNILERNNKNSSSSSRIVKKIQHKEKEVKNLKIKNEMYIGNRHGRKKSPEDSSFLDYNQYYINILESRLILDPLFTIQKLACGINSGNKEAKIVKKSHIMTNIKTHRPIGSDKLKLNEEKKDNNSSRKNLNKNNRAQTNKEFLEFLNQKESEIKTKSISARDKLKKTNEINKLMAMNVIDSYSVKAVANTNQDENLLLEEGKTHYHKDDDIFYPDENSASLAKEESKLERSEDIDQEDKPRITAENIDNLISSIVFSLRHNVFESLKQFTASSYLSEHYIYSFNYLEALSDVFMARNVSFAINKINQYAYIKNIYEALNTFSIPAKRNALAKIYSYSEQMKMFNQEEIEVYQSYLNLISLFAKRDAFAQIKEHATKIELEEYEDDEDQLIEIYKYMLNKLSNMINKRYFTHFMRCLSSINNKQNIIEDSGTIELDQENFNSNSAYWFNKSLENFESKANNESKCSQELDIKEKSLNSGRDKMKNFVVNKFDTNKSDSAIKNLSASRIKNHTYLYESLSEKSCVLECNSYESPKLHRIYMLIEEQKKANQNSRKNGNENSEILDSYNNQSDVQENLSNYMLDLQDGKMEISNRNISLIEEVLSEERESLPSKNNVNYLSHSLSLLDSINNNLDSENKLEEKDITKSYIKSKSEIVMNKSYEEISEVINKIGGKSITLKNSCDDISEVINNDIKEKSFQKFEIINTEENKSLNANVGFLVDQTQNQSESKSSKNDKEKSMKNTPIRKDKENSNINNSQNSELQENLEKSNENKLNYSNNDSINLSILSKKHQDEHSLSVKRDKTSRKNSDLLENEEIVQEYFDINKSIKSIKDDLDKSKLVDEEFSEIIEEKIDENPEIRVGHDSNLEEPAIKIVDNISPVVSPKIRKNTSDVNQSLVLQVSDNEISKCNEESLRESKLENNFQQNDELKSICSILDLNDLAEQLTSEILKDLLNSEINEPKLIPKKSFSLMIEDQQNSKNSISIFSSNSNSFSNSNTTESTPTSIFNKTIFEQKKEDTQYLYEQKILPQLIKILKQEINNNYTNIVSNLRSPFTYNTNDLLQNLIKEQTTNIKNNFLKLPIEIKERELLPKNSIMCQLEQTTASIRKECVNDKDCLDYEKIINECVIEAAEEILKKERLYGEQGAPVQWSARTRATAYKYTPSEISKNNLIKFFEEDFKNVSNTRMGLIQENNEELDFEQLNTEKEKRIIQSLTTDLYETEEVWKNFELEETQIKLELTELVLEQILNEVIEIFEHVHMSRRQPNLYQHKSIYACDDIPRLSFHQINTEYDYDVMNI